MSCILDRSETGERLSPNPLGGICGIGLWFLALNSILSAFMAGLFMPREGRISKMMISKVNYFLTTIFNPLFFFRVGAEADLTLFGADHIGPWAGLVLLFVIATVGKVLGTVVSGVKLGFHWPEMIAIGLLLNIKGHFHVYLAIIAAEDNITSISTSMAMLFANFLTIIYTSMVVANIIEHAGKRSPTQTNGTPKITKAVEAYVAEAGEGISVKRMMALVTMNTVIFIGGKDDREAIAYAGCVARHPGIKLTDIRFLLDANSENTTSARPGRPRVNTPELEEEMKLDDECFADFYDRHVAYMEKYLVNSGQTFSTLRSMEGQYGLFIVGRGWRVNSVLTVGMNDWEECPVLGPIGGILSASDFSVTASVLIIQ
ncbi:hypothetical protein Acr_15g0012860 [Actinidia rufa]|uniref:Cation/H+ exchanger domain-containing protein n=1 Tax=Actinidia rufa TaxID=165716 RepID=A0A7J0FXN1_9ERIC|nr:hypothetical protein Acr_15g0012860 [Actinidia rufa]